LPETEPLGFCGDTVLSLWWAMEDLICVMEDLICWQAWFGDVND
jgi:hypothetical protein